MILNKRKSTISCLNLEAEDEIYIQSKLPYSTLDFDYGIKYLGFHLKPKNYIKEDWMCYLPRWRNDYIPGVIGVCKE